VSWELLRDEDDRTSVENEHIVELERPSAIWRATISTHTCRTTHTCRETTSARLSTRSRDRDAGPLARKHAPLRVRMLVRAQARLRAWDHAHQAAALGSLSCALKRHSPSAAQPRTRAHARTGRREHSHAVLGAIAFCVRGRDPDSIVCVAIVISIVIGVIVALSRHRAEPALSRHRAEPALSRRARGAFDARLPAGVRGAVGARKRRGNMQQCDAATCNNATRQHATMRRGRTCINATRQHATMRRGNMHQCDAATYNNAAHQHATMRRGRTCINATRQNMQQWHHVTCRCIMRVRGSVGS
jgi:hypothetical protein